MIKEVFVEMETLYSLLFACNQTDEMKKIFGLKISIDKET
jgi:hypothetical protein